MAGNTWYVGPTLTEGAGTQSSRFTVAQACARAQAGDRVAIAPGYYTTPLNPVNSGHGSADSQRIIFEAEDPANKPIWSGASTAATGTAAPSFVKGWQNTGTGFQSTGVLSYGGHFSSGSAHPHVYRKTGIPGQVQGVLVNHPDQGSNPTGYFSCLWMMDSYNTDGGPGSGSNPDFRIHDPFEHQSASGNTDRFRGNPDPHYVCHTWQSQARSNRGNPYGFPADSLDIRLHSTANPNPNDYNVLIVTGGKCFEFSNKNFITFRNLIFRHWSGGQVSSCRGFVMDGCELNQMVAYGLIIGDGSHEAQLTNCQLIGGGANQGHHADTLNIGRCNNVTVDGCTISWGSHGGCTVQGSADDFVLRNCTLHHAGTLLSCQSNSGVASNRWTVENNVFHDAGFLEDVWVQKTPHPAFEVDWLLSGVIRRNLFCRVCIGILYQANSPHVVSGVDCRHNTVVDTQIASFKMLADVAANIHDNQIRNNIFWGVTGGDVYYRQNWMSGGCPNIHIDVASPSATLNGNTFRNNLYYEPKTDAFAPPATRGALGTFASILGPGGAAAANSTVWGPASFLSGDIDPRFVNKSADNYGLQPGSPAMEKGVAIPGEPSSSGTPDLGCVEGSGGSSADGVEITSPAGFSFTSAGAGGTDQPNQGPEKLFDRLWKSTGGTAGLNNWARSGLTTGPQSVTISFGVPKTLRRVAISHFPGGGGARNYNYSLDTSPDNATWTPITTNHNTVLPSTSEFTEVTFAARGGVQFVRLTVNSASDGFDVASIWEMRLWE